jgi:tRNA (guanine37-N1)-methyltransferase
MIIDVITLFPDMFASVLAPAAGLLGKAVEKGALAIHCVDTRDFSGNKHRTVDDTPYGGGAGMVMRPDPIVGALEHCQEARGPSHKILLAPTGAPLTQATVVRLAALPRLSLVCGRYEGMDERVRPFCDEELSIGDYVLTGGELAAMVIIDAVARRLPGVLGNAHSAIDESFESGLLEYPQYTRPAQFRGTGVPEALVSGNHERIRRWRRQQALWRTRERRPDLLAAHPLSAEDRALLDGEEP